MTFRPRIFSRLQTDQTTLAGLFVSLGLFFLFPCPAFAATNLYSTNFSSAAIGSVPDDFLVLDGGFAVQEADGNRYLELPGAPLDSFGVLFGPTFNPKSDSRINVTARFHGVGRGRRYPAFSLGLCGVGGYRLQITPAKKSLELYHGDELLASKPYDWKSDTWTSLRLQLSKSGNDWTLDGKVWTHGQPEPEPWIITHPVNEVPVAGRSSVWGAPYSGQAIRFDDLFVQAVTAASAQ